jgi:hypothetical protein
VLAHQLLVGAALEVRVGLHLIHGGDALVAEDEVDQPVWLQVPARPPVFIRVGQPQYERRRTLLNRPSIQRNGGHIRHTPLRPARTLSGELTRTPA